MAARVGGKKKYPGTAVITVSLASEDRYSICDYEASFTLATPSVSRRGGGAEDGDDTDVELEDDEFLEYSEVTFDKTAAAAAAAAVTPVASVTEHVRLERNHSRQQDQSVQEQDCVKERGQHSYPRHLIPCNGFSNAWEFLQSITLPNVYVLTPPPVVPVQVSLRPDLPHPPRPEADPAVQPASAPRPPGPGPGLRAHPVIRPQHHNHQQQ